VDISRAADARYVYLEMLFHDYEHVPTDKRIGTHRRRDPQYFADLQWMGLSKRPPTLRALLKDYGKIP
jgi:hypothetical protein